MTTPLNPPPQAYTETAGFWRGLLTSIYHLFSRVRQVDIAPATIMAGTGTPESNVTGNVGDIFIRTDGGASTVLYVKESGTGDTGWSAK